MLWKPMTFKEVGEDRWFATRVDSQHPEGAGRIFRRWGDRVFTLEIMVQTFKGMLKKIDYFTFGVDNFILSFYSYFYLFKILHKL